MPRPRTQRSDLGNLREFSKIQERRSRDLKIFSKQMRSTKAEAIKSDDRLFAALLELAVEEYGVRLNDLAAAIRFSPAAVGRWAKQINLPPALIRPLVIDAVTEIIDKYVAEQDARKPELPRGRVMH